MGKVLVHVAFIDPLTTSLLIIEVIVVLIFLWSLELNHFFLFFCLFFKPVLTFLILSFLRAAGLPVLSNRIPLVI